MISMKKSSLNKFSYIKRVSQISSKLVSQEIYVQGPQDIPFTGKQVLFKSKGHQVYVSNIEHFQRTVLVRAVLNDLKIQTTTARKITNKLKDALKFVIDVSLVQFATPIHFNSFCILLKKAKPYRDLSMVFTTPEAINNGLSIYYNDKSCGVYLSYNIGDKLFFKSGYIIRILQNIFNINVKPVQSIVSAPQKFSPYSNRLKGGKDNIFRSLFISLRNGKSLRLQLSPSNDRKNIVRLPKLIYYQYYPWKLNKKHLPTHLLIRFPVNTQNQLAMKALPWDRGTIGLPLAVYEKLGADNDGDQITVIAFESPHSHELEILSSPLYSPKQKISPTPDHILGYYLETKKPKAELEFELDHFFINTILGGESKTKFMKLYDAHEKYYILVAESKRSLDFLSIQNRFSNDLEKALISSSCTRLNSNTVIQLFDHLGSLPIDGTAEVLNQFQNSPLIFGPETLNDFISQVQSARGLIVSSKANVGEIGGCLNQAHHGLRGMRSDYLHRVVGLTGELYHDCVAMMFPLQKMPKNVFSKVLIHQRKPDIKYPYVTPFELAKIVLTIQQISKKQRSLKQIFSLLHEYAHEIKITRLLTNNSIFETITLDKLGGWR